MATCEIIRGSSYSVSSWSGGETTQVFILPRDAVYAERSFQLRISSATVTLDSSDFTPLPGFQRHIMPLEGEMRLEHEGHHTVTLKPYQSDFFEGSWKTKSYGRCVDFNLMHTPSWTGGIKAAQGGVVDCAGEYTGFYAREDLEVTVRTGGEIILYDKLAKGDFLMVHCDCPGEEPQAELAGTSGAVLAVVTAVDRRA